jgi:hypothetical protein
MQGNVTVLRLSRTSWETIAEYVQRISPFFYLYFPKILVLTGGESWMEESVKSAWLSCDALDVISIHAYGTGDFETSAIQSYVSEAQAAGKMLIFEEW